MCGICGIINTNQAPVEERVIQRMHEVASHRGPDGFGVFHGPAFAFGHRRLRILDLSENGKQPMSYGHLTITFNGEIYNYIEIRQVLIQKGYSFRSQTDTEVILAAYAEWGKDCLQHFNGMWAFAIYDSHRNEIFFARDRFGVKPLHYAKTGGQFFFGSEIRQILEVCDRRKVNEHMLLQKLICHLENHTAETLFEGIHVLPAGHFMTYNLHTHETKISRYYTIRKHPEMESLDEVDAMRVFEERLINSVNLRLRSDVLVGTCLSGGLDSSVISAVASGRYQPDSGNRFAAINARSIQKSRDESGYAQQVATHLGLDIHFVEPSYEDFSSHIDSVVRTQEEPFGSPSMFMGYFVFKKAQELGCTVMLNGQGGDEVLLGYERYFVPLVRQAHGLAKLESIWNYYRNSRLSLPQTLLFLLYFGSFDVRKRKLLSGTVVRNNFVSHADFDSIRTYAKSSSDIFALQNFEIAAIQLPKLLRYEDRNSMAHSIETRLPFLDFNVVEAGLSLHHRHKVHGGWSKYVLRRIAESYLPSEVAWRKNKFGFEAPEDIWLPQHEQTMIAGIRQSALLEKYCDMPALLRKFPGMGNWEKWMYYNVAVWERVFNVSL